MPYLLNDIPNTSLPNDKIDKIKNYINEYNNSNIIIITTELDIRHDINDIKKYLVVNNLISKRDYYNKYIEFHCDENSYITNRNIVIVTFDNIKSVYMSDFIATSKYKINNIIIYNSINYSCGKITYTQELSSICKILSICKVETIENIIKLYFNKTIEEYQLKKSYLQSIK